MMTPLAGFGLGMLIGGSLSVVFYRRRIPVANITPGMGARLGMVSGILGGGIFAALLGIGIMVFHAWESVREKLIEMVEQTAARNPDPQAQQALEFFKSPNGHHTSSDDCPDRHLAGVRDLLRDGRSSRRGPAAPQGASLGGGKLRPREGFLSPLCGVLGDLCA